MQFLSEKNKEFYFIFAYLSEKKHSGNRGVLRAAERKF